MILLTIWHGAMNISMQLSKCVSNIGTFFTTEYHTHNKLLCRKQAIKTMLKPNGVDFPIKHTIVFAYRIATYTVHRRQHCRRKRIYQRHRIPQSGVNRRIFVKKVDVLTI